LVVVVLRCREDGRKKGAVHGRGED